VSSEGIFTPQDETVGLDNTPGENGEESDDGKTIRTEALLLSRTLPSYGIYDLSTRQIIQVRGWF